MDLDKYAPFFNSPDSVRFAYLRLPKLKQALGDPKVLNALVTQLEVPGKTSVRKGMSPEDQLREIAHQIEGYRSSSTSVWRGVHPAEVLAASIYRAAISKVLPAKVAAGLWCDVKDERALLAPVAAWIRAMKLEPYAEVALGTKRADVLGYSEGGFLSDRQITVVELKNDHEQMKRGLDQLTTFAMYGHETYLACTPYFAVDYLDRHSEAPNVRHWDSEIFKKKLQAFGFGLLLVEGGEVFEVMKPVRKPPAPDKVEQVRHALNRMRAL